MATIQQALLAKSAPRNRDTTRLVETSMQRQEQNSNRRWADQRSHGEQRTNGGRGYRSDSRQPQHNPMSDGIDHINLWIRGNTPLGQLLSMEFAHFFEVQNYGTFSSCFALWVFLTTKGHPPALRKARSNVLRDLLRTRDQNGLTVDFPNARYICAAAVANRLNRDEALAESLASTGDVPIVSYTHDNNRTYEGLNADWWTKVITLLRSQLQAKMELDVSSFFEGKGPVETAYAPLTHEVIGAVRGYTMTPNNSVQRVTTPRQHPKVPPKRYTLAFASASLRREGVVNMRQMAAAELLGKLSQVEPGSTVTVEPPQDFNPVGGIVHWHLLDMDLDASGRIIRCENRFAGPKNQPRKERSEDKTELEPLVPASDLPGELTERDASIATDQPLAVDMIDEAEPIADADAPVTTFEPTGDVLEISAETLQAEGIVVQETANGSLEVTTPADDSSQGAPAVPAEPEAMQALVERFGK